MESSVIYISDVFFGNSYGWGTVSNAKDGGLYTIKKITKSIME